MNSSGLRLRASVSLLLAILLPMLAFFLLGLERYTQMRIAELDYARACEAAGQAALLSYDRQLWRDFGLWAGSREKVDFSCAENILQARRGVHFKISEQSFLRDETVLMAQIRRHMKLRSVLELGEVARRRYSRIEAAPGRALQLVPELSRSLQESQVSDPSWLLRQIQVGAGQNPTPDQPISASGPDAPVQDPLDEPEEQEDLLQQTSEEGRRSWAEQILKHFKGKCERLLLDLSPVYEAASLDIAGDDVLKPSSLEKLAEKLDKILAAPQKSYGDRLLLLEYLLAYCPAAVNLEREGQAFTNLRTPDGRLLKDLQRDGQFERMVWGSKSGEKRAKYELTALRFGLQVLAKQQDNWSQLRYRQMGRLVSTAVFILSVGEIAIEPQTFAYIFMLADALRTANGDCRQLLLGEDVPALPLPGHSLNRLRLCYRDHLRLLFLVRDQQQILKNLGEELGRLYPQGRACTFNLTIEWDGVKKQKEVQYEASLPPVGEH